MSSDPPVQVEMERVHRSFEDGAVKALDGLSLKVDAGEFVAVTGPSGCGKSTMVNLLAGLDRPTSGSVKVGGVDLAALHDLPAYRRHTVGVAFQLHNLLPHLSALGNVEVAMLGAERDRHARRSRARELLGEVDMIGRERRLPSRLSGGERQRVALARALANRPRLLVADEPTGSLDEESAARILALLVRARREPPGMTVIMVTHDQAAAAMADRVVSLRGGRLALES